MNKVSNCYRETVGMVLPHLPCPPFPSHEYKDTVDGHNLSFSCAPTHALLTVISLFCLPCRPHAMHGFWSGLYDQQKRPHDIFMNEFLLLTMAVHGQLEIGATCSPPGMHKCDCEFLIYLQTGHATAT